MHSIVGALVNKYIERGVPPWCIDIDALKEQLAEYLLLAYSVKVNPAHICVRIFTVLPDRTMIIDVAPFSMEKAH